MADDHYTFSLLYFPFEAARVRLPQGLPAGLLVILSLSFTTCISMQQTKTFPETPVVCFILCCFLFWRLAGIAPRNPISEEFRKDVLKHLPTMRSLNLDAGADYLHDWVMGALPRDPLLEVRATPCIILELERFQF